MRRQVQMESLTAKFRENCRTWWAGLAPRSRAALDAWLILHPVQPQYTGDLVPYAYLEAPAAIDPWITCKLPEIDVTAEWLADFRPNIREILPSGDVRAQFRQSELIPVADALEGAS